MGGGRGEVTSVAWKASGVKQTTTETARSASPDNRFNEQNNGCVRAF